MKRVITVAAVAALALTACSSGGGSSSSSSAASSSGGSAAPSSSSAPSSSAASSSAAGGTQVGFIYVSPLKGSSWTLAWDQARKAVETQAGATTSTVEPIPETAEAVGVMEDLISKGNKVIFATAFGYQPFVLEEAKKHSDVDFVVIGPWIQKDAAPSNVTVAFSDNWIDRYALGVLAAKSTKTKTLGFVAANPISTVIASINAFELGAQSVDKSIVTKAVFTGTWYDPPKSTQAAEALAAGGADVIAQYEDSVGALLGAQKASVWGIGSEADTSAFAPETYLSGSINNWDTFAVDAVKSAAAGTWKGTVWVGTLQNGGTGIGPINANAAPEAKTAAETALAGLTDGSIVPFTGPITDNKGKVVLPAGQQWKGVEIFDHMDFLVQGVEGTIPS